MGAHRPRLDEPLRQRLRPRQPSCNAGGEPPERADGKLALLLVGLPMKVVALLAIRASQVTTRSTPIRIAVAKCIE